MKQSAKRKLSERDICSKFIMPSLERAGWSQNQIREEVNFTAGPIVVRGNINDNNNSLASLTFRVLSVSKPSPG